ncbi:MAG TPA: hypothetical protein VK191_05740 [Symbiobacteriaceae bacterium]|nr:hypothetical protein [Symbiobacteriaceae bacterium]
MNEEKSPEQKGSAPKKEQAATTQPLYPLVTPAIPVPSPEPKPVPGGESSWAAKSGLDLTAEDFEDAIGHDADRVLRAKNAKTASAWVQGPGAVEVLIEAYKLLLGASAAAGLNQKAIHWVIPKALPKAGLLLVAPAKEGMPGAIEATRIKRGPLEFNVSEILRLAEMEVASGYRDLYTVEKVATSPIGPAIAIKLKKPLESRRVGDKKEEEQK